MVRDGGLAAVGVLVVVAGRVGGTVVRAVEGGGVARAAWDFKSGRKGDLRIGDKDRRQKREKKEKRFFIVPPLESHG